MLSQFVNMAIRDARKVGGPKILYFHNMGKFDGIILLRHLSIYQSEYEVKTPILH
jgi:hypothetical protein